MKLLLTMSCPQDKTKPTTITHTEANNIYVVTPKNGYLHGELYYVLTHPIRVIYELTHSHQVLSNLSLSDTNYETRGLLL